jgi:hypothetical protein
VSASDVAALRAYYEVLVMYADWAKLYSTSHEPQAKAEFGDQKVDLLTRLSKLSKPVLVAGCRAGASFETMTTLLKDCHGAFAEFFPPDGFASLAERVGRNLGPLSNLIALAEAEVAESRSETSRTIDTPAARKNVIRDKATEARDKWIYQQCCRGTPHDNIVADLKKKAPKKRWRIVSSKQRIQQIGKEYARRHGLPEPAPRRNL